MSTTYYVGTRKGLFIYEDHKIVRTAFLGVEVPMLLADKRDASLYAVVDHGHFGTKLHRSDDQGQSWEEISPPVYPEKPEDVPDTLCPFRGTVIPWSLQKIWALEPGGTDQEGVLWCGTLPGGLFKSTDRGQSWELMRSLWDKPERGKWAGGGYDVPGIHSVCVNPTNADDILVGISCGGAWRSKDGGETWAQAAHGMRAEYAPPEAANDPDIQDPHRIVQCKGAPDHFWTQHHNGIFRTTNDCEKWEEITSAKPSGFGFAVAVHPNDPQTAWFVPAQKDEMRIPVDGKVVVTRTRDGGESFEPLTNGLPQEHAYDLVFRHALEVDESGTQLVFGSTTGSIWFSEDQGDSWRTIALNLPPVYCVRF